MSNSLLIHRQQSRLNPAVEVGVFLTKKSKNKKTGNMPQLLIIRLDQAPNKAVQNGDDQAICGDCKHRKQADGKRSCYVKVIHGPASIYKAWKRGSVDTASLDTARKLCKNKVTRLGSYGDPASINPEVWETVLADSRSKTGYTHQWKTNPALSSVTMASVDSPEEQRQAQRLGLRTFRVRTETEPLLPGEITCPASAEAGQRTTCLTCGLCDGKRGPNDHRKNISIIAHGNGKANFVSVASLKKS